MSSRRDGFTIVEVLVAIVILTIGIMALANSAGSVTRMMSNGQRKTESFVVASSTLDDMRNLAARAGRCNNLSSGNSPTSPGYGSKYSRVWTVSGAVVPDLARQVTVTVTYQVGPRTLQDIVVATIPCT